MLSSPIPKKETPHIPNTSTHTPTPCAEAVKPLSIRSLRITDHLRRFHLCTLHPITTHKPQRRPRQPTRTIRPPNPHQPHHPTTTTTPTHTRNPTLHCCCPPAPTPPPVIVSTTSDPDNHIRPLTPPPQTHWSSSPTGPNSTHARHHRRHRDSSHRCRTRLRHTGIRRRTPRPTTGRDTPPDTPAEPPADSPHPTQPQTQLPAPSPAPPGRTPTETANPLVPTQTTSRPTRPSRARIPPAAPPDRRIRKRHPGNATTAAPTPNATANAPHRTHRN